MKIFNLPDLGEGLAEAEIVRWHVTPGDHIKVDEPMLAVETAKAIVEVPSPFSGIIKATHGKPGDMVATGALLVEFEDDAIQAIAPTAPVARAADSGTVVGSMPTSDADFVEAKTSNTPGASGTMQQPPEADRIKAIPAARALARSLGTDLATIRGTGRGELITVDDVLKASSGARSLLQLPPGGTAHITVQPHPAAPPDETEQLRGPRRAMAQSMALAHESVVGCTLFDDADLHDWDSKQDITSRLLRAIVAGCAAEPGVNAWFYGNSLSRRILSHIDVAIAVDTPEGLIAPVVRNIGGRPVADLRLDVDRLKTSTRDRTVKPEDLRDFTFMLSNFGMIAGRYATPVVVPPAVAILGSGRLSHDVVATKTGSIEAHLRMPLSLTFDHRCVTGGEAARFMAALIQDLQKGN
jgi:2-oxoisovalerate dehydrogenase E2 component (dihydrolipoyl transacylase)